MNTTSCLKIRWSYLTTFDKGNMVGVVNAKKLMDDIPNKITNHLGSVADVNLLEKADISYIEIGISPYDVPISYRGKYYL